MTTVYWEFFASGNFGENDAWKVCWIFTLSYFCYVKDSQWRRIVGFIFRCVYFWRFQGKLNPRKKFPIYGNWINVLNIFIYIIYCGHCSVDCMKRLSLYQMLTWTMNLHFRKRNENGRDDNYSDCNPISIMSPCTFGACLWYEVFAYCDILHHQHYTQSDTGLCYHQGSSVCLEDVSCLLSSINFVVVEV